MPPFRGKDKPNPRSQPLRILKTSPFLPPSPPPPPTPPAPLMTPAPPSRLLFFQTLHQHPLSVSFLSIFPSSQN